MSVLMNVVSICRNKSGEAWASCSCRKAVGSILLGAVIAFFSWSAVRGFPEDHAVAAFTSGPHPGWGPSYTTLADATCDRRRTCAPSGCVPLAKHLGRSWLVQGRSRHGAAPRRAAAIRTTTLNRRAGDHSRRGWLADLPHQQPAQ